MRFHLQLSLKQSIQCGSCRRWCWRVTCLFWGETELALRHTIYRFFFKFQGNLKKTRQLQQDSTTATIHQFQPISIPGKLIPSHRKTPLTSWRYYSIDIVPLRYDEMPQTHFCPETTQKKKTFNKFDTWNDRVPRLGVGDSGEVQLPKREDGFSAGPEL